MKKQIIVGISIITCVALCAAVWLRSYEVGDLPAEPVKTALSAEIEARSSETSYIFISADAPAPETEPVSESNLELTGITAEKEAEKPVSAKTPQSVKQSPTSLEPHNGDVSIVDGEKQIYPLGFGWIKDEGGGSVGTIVGNPGDQLTGNKVGIMGGGATVGGKGDINKQVGIMGGGTVAEDMYENGHKIGIMGSDETAPSSTSPPTYAEPEVTGDVIYTELQPPVTKDSTPSVFKPNGEPYNP
ncbi:hypothetical protein [Dehalobacter restrictus]|uniref:hypothetical protein n=1 Tax=Dehalobacter restrictus TaxID=55583 RepID=UPI00338ECBAC